MKTLKLTISAPDGTRFCGEILRLDVRGAEGELAVMAGHVSIVTSLAKGSCVIWGADGVKRTAAIHGGLLAVEGDSVTLLSGMVRFEEDIIQKGSGAD